MPAARPVPRWSWAFIAPCGAAGALAIDHGATLFTAAAPTETPFADGLLAMLAVVVAASSAFGCALLSRSALGLRARLAGCGGMLALTLITLRLGAQPAAPLAWRELRTPSGRFRAEAPGPAAFTEREVAEPGGAALVREAGVRAGGLVFRLEEREDAGAGAEALLARARARLVAAGALVVAEEREAAPAPEAGGLRLTLRVEGRRFRVRALARGSALLIASAGPEGTDDGALERFLSSIAADASVR